MRFGGKPGGGGGEMDEGRGLGYLDHVSLRGLSRVLDFHVRV